MSTADGHAGWSADSMIAAGEQADEERWNHANLSALGGIQQALLAIHAELKRANDAKDEVHPDDMCGVSDAMELPARYETGQLVTCERRFGHVKNFHRGGGKQWEAET